MSAPTGRHDGRDASSGDCLIRPASRDDAELLAQIVQEAFADVAEMFGLTRKNCPRHPAFCDVANLREGSSKGVRFFIATTSDQAIACVGMGPGPDGACELVRLAVVPAHRRRGVGRALVERVVTEAAAGGLDRVELHLIAAHQQLRRWYEARGFRSMGNWKPAHLPFEVTRMFRKSKKRQRPEPRIRRVDYDDRQHRCYAKGRQLPPETLQLWLGVAAEFLPAPSASRLRLLDLGSGTGRFSPALAERFDAEVVGVEPSGKMRRQAVTDASHPRVQYLPGQAEAIPLPDAACDAAWLSMVLHHLEDGARAVGELARVLRPGGVVLLRNSFRGRLENVGLYDFFPTAKAVDETRLPDLDETTAAFERAGLARVAHREVFQAFAPTLQAAYEKTSLRAISTFELIPEDDVEAGLRAMRAAADAEAESTPVMEMIDLLVFRRNTEDGARRGESS